MEEQDRCVWLRDVKLLLLLLLLLLRTIDHLT
jgi:hypothetical protein